MTDQMESTAPKPVPVFITPMHAQFSAEELGHLSAEIAITFTVDQLGMISGILRAAAEDMDMDLTPEMRAHLLETEAYIDGRVEKFSETYVPRRRS